TLRVVAVLKLADCGVLLVQKLELLVGAQGPGVALWSAEEEPPDCEGGAGSNRQQEDSEQRFAVFHGVTSRSCPTRRSAHPCLRFGLSVSAASPRMLPRPSRE